MHLMQRAFQCLLHNLTQENDMTGIHIWLFAFHIITIFNHCKLCTCLWQTGNALSTTLPFKNTINCYFCYSYDNPSTWLADESQDAGTVHLDHNYVDLRICEQKLENANWRTEYLEGILERRDLEIFGIQRITSDPQLLHLYTRFSDNETFYTGNISDKEIT